MKDEPGIDESKRDEVRHDVEGRQGSTGRARSCRNMVSRSCSGVEDRKRDEEEKEELFSLSHPAY
jgi:hypothetical protein